MTPTRLYTANIAEGKCTKLKNTINHALRRTNTPSNICFLSVRLLEIGDISRKLRLPLPLVYPRPNTLQPFLTYVNQTTALVTSYGSHD
jgi:hypothetical protein